MCSNAPKSRWVIIIAIGNRERDLLNRAVVSAKPRHAIRAFNLNNNKLNNKREIDLFAQAGSNRSEESIA